MQAQILAPAAVLVVWTLIVLFMIPPTRFGAIAKLKEVPDNLKKTGVRGADVEGVIPDKANWPAHNHTHLHEQPTLFYALVAIMAIMGPAALDVTLAWIYVGLRIIHSLWQIFVNKVNVRFMLFLASTIALLILGVRAVMVTLLADPSLAPQ